MPIYDEKHIKAKVKQFNCVDNTNVWGDKVPNEGVHCTCIGTMNISSVMKIDKKNHPQVYLEECKYKTNKKKIFKYIDAELDLDDSNSE